VVLVAEKSCCFPEWLQPVARPASESTEKEDAVPQISPDQNRHRLSICWHSMIHELYMLLELARFRSHPA
jgi:hypothetical protein